MALPAALLLLLASAHVGVVAGRCSNATLVSAGLQALLARYERGAAPSQPAAVRAALDLRHAAVDERTSVVRMLADLHLYWSDKRLAWNASEWDCDSTLLPAESLWLPDVELLNGAAGTGAGGDGSLRARLSAAGDVEWITRIDVAVPVALDLRAWPSDVQTTDFKFGSREHTADELDLRISDYKYATVWESGSWLIESVSGSEEADIGAVAAAGLVNVPGVAGGDGRRVRRGGRVGRGGGAGGAAGAAGRAPAAAAARAAAGRARSLLRRTGGWRGERECGVGCGCAAAGQRAARGACADTPRARLHHAIARHSPHATRHAPHATRHAPRATRHGPRATRCPKHSSRLVQLGYKRFN